MAHSHRGLQILASTYDKPYGRVFYAGHETGDLSEYDSVVDPDGDLTVTVAAALAGTGHGLSCLVNDLVDKTVRKTRIRIPKSGHLRMRPYADPNTMTVNDGDMWNIARIGCEPFTPDSLFVIAMGKTAGGDYRFRCTPRDDNGNLTARNFTITDAEHYVEVHVQCATSPTAADGRVRWWVDGDLKNTWANVDNWDLFHAIHDMRAGEAGSLDIGTSGTFYLDEITVRDDDVEIGA